MERLGVRSGGRDPGIIYTVGEMESNDRCCDECGLPEEGFALCEDRCMLQSCPKCMFLLQLYGTGCGNVRVYYLCRDCYDERMKRGFIEP